MASDQKLEKITITPDGKNAIEALFNPTQYSIEKGNQIAEMGVPGLGAPILQFVRGNTRTLSMDLFFDTYAAQTDVREHTNRVYALLGIEASTHVPPLCTIQWGRNSPSAHKWILERVSGRFTLFHGNGTPARATLGVTFKEFIPVEIQVRETVTQSADHAKLYTVCQGDTLSSIAAAEYGDPAAWRPIATKNRITNPRKIEPGSRLIIPSLPAGNR
jgi:hypothetical protein